MWYILEYNNHNKELEKITPFSGDQGIVALGRLRILELSQIEELRESLKSGTKTEIEYILIGSDSEDDLRQTHPYYFIKEKNNEQ